MFANAKEPGFVMLLSINGQFLQSKNKSNLEYLTSSSANIAMCVTDHFIGLYHVTQLCLDLQMNVLFVEISEYNIIVGTTIHKLVV